MVETEFRRRKNIDSSLAESRIQNEPISGIESRLRDEYMAGAEPRISSDDAEKRIPETVQPLMRTPGRVRTPVRHPKAKDIKEENLEKSSLCPGSNPTRKSIFNQFYFQL